MGSVRYKELVDRLNWTPAQIAQFCDAALRRLLEHAAQNVPYYEKIYRQQGVTLRDVRHLKDLTVLPLISKSDLKADPDAFLARGVRKTECARLSACSDSKHPLQVYLSHDECELLRSVEERVADANGLKGRYSRLSILPPNRTPPPEGWCTRMLYGRRDHVPTTETTAEHWRLLNERQPECIGAPLWTLNRVAGEIRKGKPLGYTPRLLLSWGEPIRRADRDALAEAFGVAPTDVYQAWEVGPIAAQCPLRDGLHVNFDLVQVEILRNGHEVGPGEVGEVVVTTLANHTMPLIRYRLGDVAGWKKGPCKCGWQGPVLESVHGQAEHSVVLPSGVFASSRRLEETLDQFENVQAYRVIQIEPRAVEVLVVPGALFQERTAKMLREKCIEAFNQQLGVEVKMVRELPLLSGPRRQSILCKVPHL